MNEFKQMMAKIDLNFEHFIKIPSDEDNVTHEINKIKINDATLTNFDVELQINRRAEFLIKKLDLLESNQTTLVEDITKCNQMNASLNDEHKLLEQTLKQYQELHLSLHKSLAQSTSCILTLEERLNQLDKASYDGTFIWHLTNVRQKISDSRESRQKSFYSPVFYTSRDGYRLTCKLYLNGNGQAFNEYVSIYLVILRGCYDAVLKWPFKQKCSFVLVDKQDEKRSVLDSFMPDPNSVDSFKRPISEMNVPSGLLSFLPLKIFNSVNVDFYNDDSLFIKIMIDTNGLEEF